MVRGGKVSSRKNFKKKFRQKDKGSDDSDEDYVVSSDENGVSERSDEDYCSFLDENASGEDNFVVEEDVEEQQPKNVRKRVGLKARNAFGSHKARKKNGQKRQRFSYQEEEDGGDEDDEDYSVDNDNDYEEEEEEEEEDVDVDVDEEVEDEDEEFLLEEEDFSDEEEPVVRKRRTNMKRGRNGVRKNAVGKVGKKRKPKVAKKPSRNKRRKKSGLQIVRNSDDDDFSDNYPALKITRRKRPVSKRRRYVVQSDIDTVLSGSSDYEYTISEEEREQVREAERLCGQLRNRIRIVPSPPRIEDSDLCQQRKPRPLVRKGKEKVEAIRAEVIKLVCGICLSEEDKRRVRGTLNCCSHFFCFSCIMEWSRVESRCPLCKQRFQTISKPARSMAGIDLREVVVEVPERDQVYQPSEEELRSYLDPYENVICIECHEGGDDNLMLLCDLCDSPAHTYCVGLGREVPEGNWYCVDCRTIALGSSSPQPSSRLSERRTTNSLFNRTFPVANRDGLDLNSLSSPRTLYVQGFPNIQSPRLPVEVQSTSPMSQAIAPTLTRRRYLRQHINHMRSSSQMGLITNRTDVVSAINPCGGGTLSSQMGQSRESTAERTITQEMAIPNQTMFGETLLHDSPSPLMQHGGFLNPETSHLPRQALQDPHPNMPTDRTSSNGTTMNPLRGLAVENTITVDRNLNGVLRPELAGVNSSNCEQIHHCSNVINTASDNGSLPRSAGDEKDYCAAREQLRPFIDCHLKNLSTDIDLGQGTAADIATKAASTILGACGFEHSINDAYRAPPPSQCSHIELSMGEGHRSLIKGLCLPCFDLYVRDVVKKIIDDVVKKIIDDVSWLNLRL